uniref:Uncharacterized protein n=1 Tax=Leersia perrieri TaxID=77586 RepID=A0A0D9VB85_9ORYZ
MTCGPRKSVGPTRATTSAKPFSKRTYSIISSIAVVRQITHPPVCCFCGSASGEVASSPRPDEPPQET